MVMKKAGVAVASKDFITHVESPIRTANFQKAFDEGRVCKCVLDIGWDANFSVYIIYCKSGGTKLAKDYNEWLVDCCRGEIAGDEGSPNIIMADFNATPSNIGSIKEMIEDELWEDVGHVANWRGGYQTNPRVKPEQELMPPGSTRF